MDENRFNAMMEELKRDALKQVKNVTPVDTGNLRNSVRSRDLPNGGFEIYINTEQAPYAKHTIDPWTDGRFGNKQNPNEGWTDTAGRIFVNMAKLKLRGNITGKGTGE